MTIRFAKIKEFKSIRQFDPHSKYIDPEKIKQKINNHEIIIGTDQNEILGFIKFSYFWATRPYIDLIWVKESLRKQGIGKKLYRYFEDYLVKEGYTHLFTSAEEKDIKAQTWHQSQGFTQCGQVTALNLPHEQTAEIFYFKRIAKGDLRKDKLKTYEV